MHGMAFVLKNKWYGKHDISTSSEREFAIRKHYCSPFCFDLFSQCEIQGRESGQY